MNNQPLAGGSSAKPREGGWLFHSVAIRKIRKDEINKSEIIFSENI